MEKLLIFPHLQAEQLGIATVFLKVGYLTKLFYIRKIETAMTTEIHKNATPEEIKALLARKKPAKKSLREFVGKLQRGVDGLTYQKEARDEWN